MNYGLPLVGTNVGDNSHLVLDNQTGYLTRPYDHPGIAEKLQELVLNYPKRITFGEKGFEHCRENYSMERFTSGYLAFIDSLNP
jgi:glycosyltransferase involved in cell wall biosynthesis